MTNPESKMNVRERMGNPDGSGVLEGDTGWIGAVDYDVYYVKGPVYSFEDELENKLFVGMTWCIGEFYSFPVVLVDRLSGFFTEYTLLFLYTENGAIRMNESIRGRISEDDLPL